MHLKLLTALFALSLVACSSGPTRPEPRRLLLSYDGPVAAALREANPDAPATIPADALTASASGLDPHISPEYAAYQAPRVAQARGITLDEVLSAIAERTEGPALGFIGTERVNVTLLNADLARADAVTAGQ